MRYADSCCSYTEIYHPTHQYVFTGPCMSCKTEQAITVLAPELYVYRSGQLIQQALSNSADEREFLMSGICPACWKKMFGDEDDESLEKYMDPDILLPYDGDGPDITDECDGCGLPHIDCECEELDFRDESEGLSSGDID